MAEKRVLELRKLLQQANEAYYDQATPFMSDQHFDELLSELSRLEKQYNLDIIEHHLAPLKMIKQTPGCCDQYINTLVECCVLVGKAHSTDQ